MNIQRRKEISRIKKTLEEAINDLQNVLDDEQAAFDNLPENLQESDRATEMQDYIDNLETAIGNIEEALDELTNIE